MDSISQYTIQELLFELPLYKKLSIDVTAIEKNQYEDVEYNEEGEEYTLSIYEESYPKDFDNIIKFLEYNDKIYNYCHECKRENSLKVEKIDVDKMLLERSLNAICDEYEGFENFDKMKTEYELKKRINILTEKYKYFAKVIKCCHNPEHKQIYIYKLEVENSGKEIILQKIGQDPSSVQIFNNEIRDKYKRYKNYDDIKSDLSKAIILHKEGFSIGGFVHLRRVLEKVVDYKYEEAKERMNEDDRNNFKSATFKLKIKMLKDELPESLTENKSIYSILSKGIHSLEDEECYKYFKIINKSIYLILDDLLNLQEKDKLVKLIKKEVNNINSNINSNKSHT